jgi:uncharacterized membrane protein
VSDVRAAAPVDVEDEGYDAAPDVGRWRPWVAFALSLIGFGISMYLTIDHFKGIAPYCSSKGFVDCQLVTTSKYSHIFGIPVSLLGLLFYTAMVGINVPRLWRVRAPWVAWARLGLAVSGIAFVLYLLAAELFSIKAICLWCTGVHVATFLLFVLVVSSFPLMTGRGRQYQEWDEDAADA